MATYDQVYKELYPTFAEVRLELIEHPNDLKKPKHLISNRKCHIHDAYMWLYKKTQLDCKGKPLFAHICRHCQKEKKRLKWIEKEKNSAILLHGSKR